MRKTTPAVKVAIAAVALSVAVMLVSVAVVMGFRNEITARISGFNSHITVYAPASADGLIYLSPSLKGAIEDEPYVEAYSLEMSMPAIAKTEDDFKGLYLRSFEGGEMYGYLGNFIEEGKMPDFTSPGSDSLIIISRKMADELKLKAEMRLPFYFIGDNLKVRNLKIVGIYNTHFDFYDDIFAFTSPGVLRGIIGAGEGRGTAIRIVTDNVEASNLYASKMQRRLEKGYSSGEISAPYSVDDISHQGANYFSWLSLLDTNVAVILILMSVVAVVTLIAALLILVIDKIKLIGVLRGMGASGGLIRSLFLYLSLRIALTGMICGNAIALITLAIQQKWHFVPLDADSYYMDYVPVTLSTVWIIVLNLAVLAIVAFMLLVPTYAASRVSPVKAMAYDE